MKIKEIIRDKNMLVVIANLSADFVALLLLAYGMILFSEAILPGMISTYLSLSTLTMLLVFSLLTSAFLIKQAGISENKNADQLPTKNKYLTRLLVFFALILIALSLFGFPFWIISITLILSLAILFYLKKEILS